MLVGGRSKKQQPDRPGVAMQIVPAGRRPLRSMARTLIRTLMAHSLCAADAAAAHDRNSILSFLLLLVRV